MKIYKIMWLPGTKRVIWDIKNEKQIPLKCRPYLDIASLNFDLNKWAKEFGKLYHLWLHEDDKHVFDLNHEINRLPLELLINLNKMAENYKVLYWFDVNRDEYPAFKWEHCPISKTLLKAFNEDVPRKNKYCSDIYPLIFPG